MKFTKKNLHDVNNYATMGDVIRSSRSRKSIARRIIMLLAILLVCVSLVWGYMMSKKQLQNVSSGTLNIAETVIGDPMETDEYGNINVLLLGFGGMEHPGGFLTDSMMIASFNPTSQAVTMVSLPRDLFINKDGIYKTKINSLMAFKLNEISDYETNFAADFGEAELFLREKVEEITGLTIPYYVGVSFSGFEKFVDALGGVTIDVPQSLNDPYFPDENTKGYDPLIIANGLQTMDGKLALKYARSRQTTSDFSRSYRQQQLLAALIHQIQSSFSWNNIGNIEKIYTTYKEAVYTNISLQNALSMNKYRDQVKNFYSYVLSYDCDISYQLTDAGCLLYGPDRESFGGSAVLLPVGATASNVSYYKRIKDFVYFVVHNQKFLNEKTHIVVENAIDKTYATQNNNYRSGRANTLARKLKQYGFDIVDTANSENQKQKTTVHTYFETFDETLKMLRLFIDFDIEHHDTVYSGDTNIDIRIELGNSFIDELNQKDNKRLFW